MDPQVAYPSSFDPTEWQGPRIRCRKRILRMIRNTAANIYDMDLEALSGLFQDVGERSYRALQVYQQLYIKLAECFDEMTDLPQKLREFLTERTRIGNLEFVTNWQGDGGMTQKVLFRLPGGETIETVLMIYSDRATVCVSSQAGCPMGCVFCATAKLGFLKDLTRGQIVEQVMWAARALHRLSSVRSGNRLPTQLSNIVFMGMGESFNNYDEWWGAVEQLHDPKGFNMGARSFTVSTVGLVPGILRLAEERLPVNLAISLHAAEDHVRSEMMPVNKAYPIQTLLAATRDYAVKTGRRVSFEYVLLEGKNDAPEQAQTLVHVLRDGPLAEIPHLIHVNLIPWNPVLGAPLARSCRRRVLAFQRVLQDDGIPCTVRVERGVEINAACGQLAGVAT